MNRRYFTKGLGLFGLLALPLSKATAQSPSPLIYKAKLTQTGEDGPVADELVNTLGASIGWQRVGNGYYVGLASEYVFNGARVFCYQPVRDNSGDVTTGSAIDFAMDSGGSNAIYLYAYGEGEDGIIGHRDIEGAVFIGFEVYPDETRLLTIHRRRVGRTP